MGASKPCLKDPMVRCPIEDTMQKLEQILEWHKENGTSHLIDLVHLANGSPNASEAVEQPTKLKLAKAIAVSLNNASIYWHGFTKDGNPILWVRTNRSSKKPN